MENNFVDILEKFINPEFRFRDPIYGFIKVNDQELKIIDTLIFQRLRRIHQLSLNKYVYPTAEHSRFTHSIGVLQMATNIFLNLYKNSKWYFDEYFKEDIEVALKTLRFAALLHDIGHTPFSHSAEDVLLGDGIKHEQVGQFIIENYPEIKNTIKSSGIRPKDVSSLLYGNVPSRFAILKDIISGLLDADRADYLLRDSYFCGVKYGEYDFNRFFQIFSIKEDRGGIRLAIKEEDIYLVEAFLLARYHYTLQVPFHRTRAGYDIVLRNYINFLKEDGRIPDFIKIKNNKVEDLNFEEFCNFDDYYIFENVKKDCKSNKWARMLLRQEHLIPVFDHIVTETNKYEVQHLISELEENKGLEREKDFFVSKNVMKVSSLLKKHNYDEENDNVEDKKNNEGVGIIRKNRDRLYSITDYSIILKQLIEPVKNVRIYLERETKEKLEREFQSHLDWVKKIEEELENVKEVKV